MDIKAIETVWKGHRFRSRVEARWAVFFDVLGIKWQYESEGLDIDGLWYLPDFQLDTGATFVEIKPSNAFDDDFKKPMALASKGKRVIVIQGDPWPDEYMAWVTYSASCYECHLNGQSHLEPWPTGQFGVCLRCGETAIHCLSRNKSKTFSQLRCGRTGDLSCIRRGCEVDVLLTKAYKAARQARFEHGEEPVI